MSGILLGWPENTVESECVPGWSKQLLLGGELTMLASGWQECPWEEVWSDSAGRDQSGHSC